MEYLPLTLIYPVFFISVIVFQLQGFYLLVFIPRYFILFDAVVNGIVFLISIWYFLVSIKKCNKFLYINFVSCDFTEFIDESY